MKNVIYCLLILLLVMLIIGWVLNLVSIIGLISSGAITAELVIRLVGLMTFFLGGVFGWF